MKTVIAEAFSDGDVGLYLEDENGDAIALRAPPKDWRRVIEMLSHQISVSENDLPSLTYPYVCGHA